MTTQEALNHFWQDIVEPVDHDVSFKLGETGQAVNVQFHADMTWCFVTDDGEVIDFQPTPTPATGMNMRMKGHAKATVTGPDGKPK